MEQKARREQEFSHTKKWHLEARGGGRSTNCTWQSNQPICKRMRTGVVHVRMASASVWKEEDIKDSLPCKEFSEFKVSFLITAFSK